MSRSSCTPKDDGDLNIVGTIKLTISKISEMPNKVETRLHTIANLPWLIQATKYSEDNVEWLGLFVSCNQNSESTLWSCNATIIVCLNSLLENKNQLLRIYSQTFNSVSHTWGYKNFVDFKALQHPHKGYVLNDTADVEASIIVHKLSGVRPSSRLDFASPKGHFTDCTLVIDGVRLHVSKGLLAMYSPVFASKFFGNYRNSYTVEERLDDVKLDQFIELLHVLYPSRQQINADNVEYMLELGQKYEIQFLMDECERYLLATKDFQNSTKILLADRYHLPSLQEECFANLKNVADFKNLTLVKGYDELSDASKTGLLEKLLKIV